jgi:serine/threonine-protein kinase RsbW
MKIPRSRPSPPLFQRVIPSRLDAVDDVCREVRLRCRERGLDGLGFGLELVLRECLTNAILHGHGGDPAKRVRLSLLTRPRCIRVQVTDEGPGFDWRAAQQKPLSGGTATSGRGLAIAAAYAHRVRFNPCGNQITLWFHQGSKLKGNKL